VSRTNATAALVLGALLLSPLACSRDDTATSPQLSPSAALSRSAFDADGDGQLNDAEQAVRHAAEAGRTAAKPRTEQEKRAAREAQKVAFEALRDQWRAYKDSVKKELVWGADIVRCEPLPGASQTKTIGPRGGELRVGPHRLVIPAGALATDVEITGTSAWGARRGVEFEPHGLQFRQPVRLTMSFEKCVLPAAGDVLIVYTALGNKIAAEQPSLSDDELKTVDAWTDHFSGYAVAVGRR
jgi:hypothetical protein